MAPAAPSSFASWNRSKAHRLLHRVHRGLQAAQVRRCAGAVVLHV